MIIIKKKESKGFQEIISVCEDATPGTWGSHQLLLQDYGEKEPRQIGNFGPGNPEYDQMMFNTEWLRSIETKYGELHCEYCGRQNLKIIPWYEKPDIHIMATTDHFYPKKKYPHLARDTKNFVVACHRCNNNKKAKKYTKNDIRFPYPEERIF